MENVKLVYLDGENLTIEDVINIAERGYNVNYSENKKSEIRDSRKLLDIQLREHPEIKIYGTNVLHGDLKDREVPLKLIKLYQKKYMKAHNCGTGNPLLKEIVRAIMVIRLNSFARAKSGMRMETCQLMLDMLNQNVTPWVLEEGSVGASGDLVPLSMIGAVMIGLREAKAYYNGKLYSARKAFEKAGLQFTTLDAKEAMGLTNGSTFIAAGAVFAVRDAELLLRNASISAALSIEAIRGEQSAFSSLINDENRKHRGQLWIARQMRNLLESSRRASQEAQIDFFTDKEKAENANRDIYNLKDNAEKIPAEYRKKTTEKIEKINQFIKERKLFAANNEIEELRKYLKEKKVIFLERIIRKLQKDFGQVRVQDRYSFRSVPQVHGPAYEAVKKMREVVSVEINSVTDNPLFYDDGEMIRATSGANFHGQPLAAVIDYVKITLTALGLISDRRSFSLLDERLSYGLPADLAFNTLKADGGLMITQYAGAARAAECRVLSTPSSITSISTAANQEDFVSMGSIGILHLQKVIKNVQIIIGIELLCALRGIQITQNNLPAELQTLGNGTAIIFEKLNEILKPVKGDKYLRTDMEKVIRLVKSGELVSLVTDSLEVSDSQFKVNPIVKAKINEN